MPRLWILIFAVFIALPSGSLADDPTPEYQKALQDLLEKARLGDPKAAEFLKKFRDQSGEKNKSLSSMPFELTLQNLQKDTYSKSPQTGAPVTLPSNPPLILPDGKIPIVEDPIYICKGPPSWCELVSKPNPLCNCTKKPPSDVSPDAPE